MSADMMFLLFILGCMFCAICCFALNEIPKRYYNYKELLLKENEKTNQESIILAQKVAEKEKEAEKTKQLQIKADYKEKYGETLHSI